MTRDQFFHNVRVSTNLVFDYTWIFGIIYFHQNISSGLFSYIVCCWLIGIKQFSIGESLLHEASHGILFTPKKLNKVSALLVAYPFFQTIENYRKGHSTHHKKLKRDGDPLLEREKQLMTKKSFFWEWFVSTFSGIKGFQNFKKNLNKLSRKDFHPVRLFWASALILSFFLGLQFELLIYWIIPFHWCQTSLVHWSELTDHYLTETHSRSVKSWFYNFFVAHNGGYHAAHHFRPNVPFYRLPKLQKEEANRIKTEWTNGFWHTYRTLKQRHHESLKKFKTVH